MKSSLFFIKREKNEAEAQPQRGKCLRQEPGHHLWIEVVRQGRRGPKSDSSKGWMIPVFSQGSQGIKMAEQMEGFATSRYETGG